MSDAEIPYTRIPFDDIHTRDSKPSEVEQATPAYKPEDLLLMALNCDPDNEAAVISMLRAGADAMEKRDELLVGNQEISVKLIAQRSREFILEKAINQARAWYTEDSDLHEKQGRTVKSEICLERANWFNRQLEVLPPSGEDALAKAEARVKELEAALKPFAVFAERGRLKPMRGLDDVFYAIHSGEPEREAELRFSDCDKARAALEVKP